MRHTPGVHFLSDADPARAAAGLCVWIAGAPGTGKSTVGAALRLARRAPLLDLGELREPHLLHRDWSDANPVEEGIAFEHLCFIANNYLAHGCRLVLATDLLEERLATLPRGWGRAPYRILTLVVRDEDEHRRRVTGERDSGFRDAAAAIRWNADVLRRPLLPHETRLDTTGQQPGETIAAAESLLASWLAP